MRDEGESVFCLVSGDKKNRSAMNVCKAKDVLGTKQKAEQIWFVQCRI